MVQHNVSFFQKTFWIATLISLILVSAALLKWLFPPVRVSSFYVWVGGIEIVLAVALWAYRLSWRIWAVLVLVLAIWAGFSLYTTIFGLPCSCLGSALPVPRGTSLILNGLMLCGAWHILTCHPSCHIRFKEMSWFFAFFFIFGFVFSLFYNNY